MSCGYSVKRQGLLDRECECAKHGRRRDCTFQNACYKLTVAFPELLGLLPENAVRSTRYQLIAIAIIALAQSGCGTMHNLMADPDGEPPDAPRVMMFGGPGICMPFGGVARSALLGFGGTPLGVSTAIGSGVGIVSGEDPKEGFTRIGLGMRMAGAGLIAIADTPLSLAGDLVTWPIAYAREKRHPWATWWSSDPGIGRLLFGAAPTTDDQKTRKDQASQ
jgi:uncharacterized protein YceK